MFEKKKKEKIYISCCTRSKPEWPAALTIQDAMREAGKQGYDSVFRPRVGEALICRARNNDIVEFMQTDCDILFSFDDDIVLPPHTLYRLVERQKDIIGGIYRIKEEAHQLAMRISDSGPNWTKIMKEKLTVPAIYVSTGCFMVRRHVILGMIKKFPELEYKRNVTNDTAWALYMPYIYKGEYLSEDWAFCQRAKEAGYEVWIDGSVKCAHWGKKSYALPGS